MGKKKGRKKGGRKGREEGRERMEGGKGGMKEISLWEFSVAIAKVPSSNFGVWPIRER